MAPAAGPSASSRPPYAGGSSVRVRRPSVVSLVPGDGGSGTHGGDATGARGKHCSQASRGGSRSLVASHQGDPCPYRERSRLHPFATSSSRSSRAPGPPTSAARWCSRAPQNAARWTTPSSTGARSAGLRSSPATRGAAPSRFAWQARSIQTPGKRAVGSQPEQFTPAAVGYTSPFGPPNCLEHRTAAVGRPPLHHVGCGPPVELHPGTLEFVAEVGHVDSWGGSSMAMAGVLPFLLSSAHPVADPRAGLPLDGQARARHGARASACGRRSSATTGPTAPRCGTGRWTASASAARSTRSARRVTGSSSCDSGNFKADPAEMMGGERTMTIDDEVPVWLVRKDELEGLPSGTPVTPVVLHACRRPPGTTTPAGTTPTASRWCGRAWTSWTSASTCGPTTSTSTATRSTRLRSVSTTWPWRPRPSSRSCSTPSRARCSSRGASGRTGRSTSSSRRWTGASRADEPDAAPRRLPGLSTRQHLGARPRLYEGRIDLDPVAGGDAGRAVLVRARAAWSSRPAGSTRTSATTSRRRPSRRATRAPPPREHVRGREPGGHDGYVVQPVCSDDGLRIELFDAARRVGPDRSPR